METVTTAEKGSDQFGAATADCGGLHRALPGGTHCRAHLITAAVSVYAHLKLLVARMHYEQLAAVRGHCLSHCVAHLLTAAVGLDAHLKLLVVGAGHGRHIGHGGAVGADG